jgi:hypothetical protein
MMSNPETDRLESAHHHDKVSLRARCFIGAAAIALAVTSFVSLESFMDSAVSNTDQNSILDVNDK